MQISQFSTAGKRETNEDTVYAMFQQPSGALLIIADGLGGHSDGKVASELACETVRRLVEHEDPAAFVVGGRDLQKSDLMQAFLYDIVRQASAMVWHEARQRGTDMQSTLLAVILTPGMGYAGHVGDCALFLSETGVLPVAKMTSEHRRGSSLIRTLGAEEQVTPDILPIPFDERSVLILGCDGFWEHVPPERMMRTLQNYPTFLVARELVAAALEAGSQDNVSVIAVTGEDFVSRHAANQMKTCAAVLADRGDDPDVTADRRKFLEFCVRHATSSSQTPSLIAQTLTRLPDSRQHWDTLQSQLPAEIRQRVASLLPAEEPAPVVLPRPIISLSADTPGPDKALAPTPTAGPVVSATVADDAGADYQRQIEKLIDADNYFGARVHVKSLLITHPEMRQDLTAWLRQHLRKSKAESIRFQEEVLFDEYLLMAPDDVDTACLYAEKLWRQAKHIAAWRIFKSCYQDHPAYRARISEFLRGHEASEDSAVVLRFVELASQPDVRGPGIAWALKALEATAPRDARQRAFDILRDWPPSTDTDEIRQWLHPVESRTPATDSLAVPVQETSDSLVSLKKDLARLTRELTAAEIAKARLRQQLEESNALLSERDRTIQSQQDRLDQYDRNIKSLGSMVLRFQADYPEQFKKLWPQELWKKWEDYLTSIDVRPASRSTSQPEDKKSWIGRFGL